MKNIQNVRQNVKMLRKVEKLRSATGIKILCPNIALLFSLVCKKKMFCSTYPFSMCWETVSKSMLVQSDFIANIFDFYNREVSDGTNLI